MKKTHTTKVGKHLMSWLKEFQNGENPSHFF
jgi:hypothetical protein